MVESRSFSVKILVFSIFRPRLAETRLFIFMIDLFGYIHSYMKPSWATLDKNLVESRWFLQEKILHLCPGIFSLGTSLQQPFRILGCIMYKQITCMEGTSVIWRRKHYFWANMLFRKIFCKLDVQGGGRGQATRTFPDRWEGGVEKRPFYLDVLYGWPLNANVRFNIEWIL